MTDAFTMSSVSSKSIHAAAPNFSQRAFLSDPVSMAIVESPMYAAYCSAKVPRPPPAPGMAIHWPARARDLLSAL